MLNFSYFHSKIHFLLINGADLMFTAKHKLALFLKKKFRLTISWPNQVLLSQSNFEKFCKANFKSLHVPKGQYLTKFRRNALKFSNIFI